MEKLKQGGGRGGVAKMGLFLFITAICAFILPFVDKYHRVFIAVWTAEAFSFLIAISLMFLQSRG